MRVGLCKEETAGAMGAPYDNVEDEGEDDDEEGGLDGLRVGLRAADGSQSQ